MDVSWQSEYGTTASDVGYLTIVQETPLAAPTIVIHSDGNSVTLNWNPVPGAHSYQIYGASSPEIPITEPNMLETVIDTSFVDTQSIESFEEMFYVVIAVP